VEVSNADQGHETGAMTRDGGNLGSLLAVRCNIRCELTPTTTEGNAMFVVMWKLPDVSSNNRISDR
jgi:hypothetical protein